MTTRLYTNGPSYDPLEKGMFGGNLLWQINDMDPGFKQTMDDFNLQVVRWPGGAIAEGYFDPTNPDVPLEVSRSPNNPQPFGETVLTFTETMEWAKETGRAVGITLPTQHIIRADGSIDYKALEDIRDFVKVSLQEGGKYADAKIASFEIGNEYWGTELTGSEYGKIANLMIQFVERGIQDSGADYNPDILVQVGTPWGVDFKPGGKYHDDGLSWKEQLEISNSDIISELSPTSKNLVDGIISHLYYTVRDANISSTSGSQLWAEKYVQDMWSKAGVDSGYNFTEWNVHAQWSPDRAGNQHPGPWMSGVMIETFEMMIKMDTDSAFVWPINQNTPNDLAGGDSSISGKLSATGAAFKLLSDNVQGMRFKDLNIENNDKVESSFYTGSDRAVLFISEANGGTYSQSFDLSGIIPNAGAQVRITQSVISRDESMDDFVGWDQGAKITETAFKGSLSDVSVKLKPYEVIMIEVDWSPILGSSRYGTTRADKIMLDDVGQNAYGYAGNDTIGGGSGHDSIYGGEGDDVIFGAAGNDHLHGGSGNDKIYAGYGHDKIYGNWGNDLIHGGNGNDSIHGGNGNDTIFGGNHNDVINGGEGNDAIYGQNGDDNLNGAGGHDLIDGGAGNDTIWGGFGNDTLRGSAGNDTIDGGAGNDRIGGGYGNDLLYGGDGNDFIWGGSGQDSLHGGSGDDRIWGHNGYDRMFGNAGDDVMYGGNGNDTIWGGNGNDMMYGQSGHDVMFGGANNDVLSGGDGNDVLVGGHGNDTILGGAGNDKIYFGDSHFQGGAGQNHAWGGSGADTFIFGDGAGWNRIYDFQDGLDKIDLSASGVETMDDFKIYDRDGFAVIDYEGGKIRIDDISSDTLTSDDFIFG